MTITNITALSGGGQDIQRTSAKLQSVIASVVSGNKFVGAGDNVAAVSLAAQLQSGTAGLRQISGNLAQARSVLQVAGDGVSQIQQALQQLQAVAQQAASPVLNDDNRKVLNQQFQQLVAQIDQVASRTNFNNKSLLDGTANLSLGDFIAAEGDAPSLDIADLTVVGLFGGKNPGLLTPSATEEAIALLGEALAQVLGVRTDIGAFAQTVDFASASVDSALINQQAALSNVADTDFTEAATALSLLSTQQQAATAAAVQGNKLTPVVLQLIS